MPSKLPPQLRKLKGRQNATSGMLIKYLVKAQAHIMARISWYAAKKDIAARAITREQLFDEIETSYSELGTGISRQIKDLLGTVAKDAHAVAAEETGKLMRYDPERNKRYFDLVRPGNSRNLAATFTESMTKDAIRRLRWSFVDAFRQATVEGLTANETHRLLQDKWNTLSADANNFRFVDAAGRKWENARYMQMLVRTNSARVHRESYIDSLVGMGFTLASVSTDSGEENCSVCDRWEGRVIRIGGDGDGFPTYEEALADGLFHPNCTHRLEYVDETAHKGLIDKWRGQPKPEKTVKTDRIKKPLDLAQESAFADLKAKRRPDASKDEAAALEIEIGKAAADLALTGTDVPGAIHVEGLGDIDFRWGDSRRGIRHIVERRDAYLKAYPGEGPTGAEVVKLIPQTLAMGQAEEKGVGRGRRVEVIHNGVMVVLSPTWDGKAANHWVLSAYDIDPKKAGYRMK